MKNLSLEHCDFIFEKMLSLIPDDINVKPSEWAEQNRSISREFSERSGSLDFNNSPFWREPVDCFSPISPVKEVSIMKPAQIGFTQIVLETIIGFAIALFARAILYVSADKELAERNMSTRIDSLIANSNIADKIKASVQKKHNNKTGDTKSLKEFYGGFISAMGANNADKLRQIGFQLGLCDEVDTYKADLQKQGSTLSLIRARFMAFVNSYKILWGSTPLFKGSSNIEALFKEGDQRYYNVPCPHCGKMQRLIFGDQEGAGLKYQVDEAGELIADTVYYQCENGCKIQETSKYEMMLEKDHGGQAEWIPTAKPKRAGSRSYHINSLYSNFMPWKMIVTEWLACRGNKQKLQVFLNNYLAETWEENVEEVKLSKKWQNIRPYRPATIPNNIATKDGNSKIVIVTAAIDVNGRMGEAKGWLAFEIKGHCLDGQTYSIAKAEIHGVTDPGGSAWIAAKKIIESDFMSDDGITYHINITGVDVGFKPESGYWFANYCQKVVPLAGRSTRSKNDKVIYKTRVNLGERWSIDTIYYKNLFADNVRKEWSGNPTEQPMGYINFPDDKRLGGCENLYAIESGAIIAGNGYDNDYFKCIGSEYPVVEKEHPDDETGTIIEWKKRNSRSPTHFWDCMIYNMACRDIFIEVVGVEVLGIKKPDPISIMTYLLEIVETEKRHWD